MKKICLLALMTLGAAVLASGCMVVNEKAMFKASSKVEMPDISGAFTDPQQGTFLLARDEKNTNSFTLTSPDKQTMNLIFTPLASEGRYVVQVANPAGPEVLLGLVALADQSVDIYALKPPSLAPLAKKHGLTLDERGFITKNPGEKKLLAFFNEAFDPKYSDKATSIKPGSGSEAKPEKKPSRRSNRSNNSNNNSGTTTFTLD